MKPSISTKRHSYSLNMVYKTVFMWYPKFPDYVEIDCLIDAGKETLLKTRQKFIPNKKVKFKTYLITALNNKMKSELAKVHKPVLTIEDENKKPKKINALIEYKDMDTLQSNGQEELALIANITFLYKRLSKESIEMMELILKAPEEMIKLGYSNKYSNIRSILKFLNISKCMFNKLKQEAYQVLK